MRLFKVSMRCSFEAGFHYNRVVVIIRNLERYNLLQFKPTESEAEVEE